MNETTVIDEILLEWCYKSPTGLPDLDNLEPLIEAMRSLDASEELIESVISELKEARDDNEPVRKTIDGKSKYLVKYISGNSKGSTNWILRPKKEKHKIITKGQYRKDPSLHDTDDQSKASAVLNKLGAEVGDDNVVTYQGKKVGEIDGGDFKVEPEAQGFLKAFQKASGSEPQQSEPQVQAQPQVSDNVTLSDSIPGKKVKQLDQKVKPSRTKTFTERLQPTEKGGYDQHHEQDKNPEPPPQIELLKHVKRNPKVPVKYYDALNRMLNTKYNNRTKRWGYYSSESGGAGDIRSQAGEMMTLMSVAMPDKEWKVFSSAISNHINQVNQQTGGKDNGVVTNSWVKAADDNRKSVLHRLKRIHGPNVEIEGVVWDTGKEVEDGLGFQDYKTNKGFSTDYYARIKDPKTGKSIIDEVSLKKDANINFLNSTTGKVKNWFKDAGQEMPDEINSDVQTKYQAEQLKRIYNKNKETLIAETSKLLDDEYVNSVVSQLDVTPEEVESGMVASERKLKDQEVAKKRTYEILKARKIKNFQDTVKTFRNAIESKKMNPEQAIEKLNSGKYNHRNTLKVLFSGLDAIAASGNEKMTKFVKNHTKADA